MACLFYECRDVPSISFVSMQSHANVSGGTYVERSMEWFVWLPSETVQAAFASLLVLVVCCRLVNIELKFSI
jgi:hypothetical protein